MPSDVGTYIWDVDHQEWKNIGNFIGEQGAKGDKGDTGDTGATPNITATATVTQTTGTPSVSVTKTGTLAAPVLNFAFSNIKGETGATGSQGERGLQGPAGPQGPAGVPGGEGSKIYYTNQTDILEDEQSVYDYPYYASISDSNLFAVLRVGDMFIGQDPQDSNEQHCGIIAGKETGVTIGKIFFYNRFGMRGPKGDQGIQGITGAQGPAGSKGDPGSQVYISSQLINDSGVVTGIPNNMFASIKVGDLYMGANSSYNVAKIGKVVSKSSTNNTLNLNGVTNLAGPKGDKGDPGDPGTVTATATVNATIGTPSVQVVKTKNGDNTNFQFNFSNLKGATGSTGPQGPRGPQGIQGETGATGPQGVQGPTGATGPQGNAGPGVPTGGSTGQVLVKASSNNYDTEWETIQKLPDPENYNYLDVLTVLSVGPNQKGYVPHHFKELPDTPRYPSGEYILRATASNGVGYDATWDRDTDIHVKYWATGPTSSLGSHTTSIVLPSGATIENVMASVYVSGAGNYTGLFPGYSIEDGRTGQLGTAYLSSIVSYNSSNRSITYTFAPVMRQIIDSTTNPNLVWSYASTGNVSMPSVYMKFLIFYTL